MLLEILAHHARWSPSKPAIVSSEGQAASYPELYRSLQGLAFSLRSDFPQILAASPVAVACSDRRLQFLLLLGLEYLGVVSLPFVTPPDRDVKDAIRQCPLLLCDQAIAEYPGSQIILDEAWLVSAMQRSFTTPFLPARWQAHQIVSIIVTSGSSGVAKTVRLSYQARDTREANRAWRYGFSPSSRYLCTLATSVSTIAVACRATLRSGGTVVFSNPALGDRLFDGITHTTLMPAHIRGYLDTLPANFVRHEKLRIISIGAPLSDELRERVTTVLNADVDSNYGSNEGGSFGRMDLDGVGHIVPGTFLKILDQDQQEVAPGVVGNIWAQNGEMAEGYSDELLTKACFVDGWFSTGDLGVITGPRTFKLAGRSDAMMNLGGLKVAPEAFEAVLIPLGIARDLAVTSVPQPDGFEHVYVCLEQPLFSDQELINRMNSVFGPNVNNVHIVFVDKIPRGATSKIQRSLVHALARANKPRG